MKKCIKFVEIDSTQNYAKRIAEKCDTGTIVIAEKQTQGRGRFERKWYSPKGGLYFSIILKPEITPDQIPLLSKKMASAILDTLKKIVGEKYELSIKPPNDIMVRKKKEEGRRKIKKIAGILTESSVTKNKIDWVVLGVGININNEIPKGLKDIAISLKEITGKKTNIIKILNIIVKKFSPLIF